jgi:hypothetical protein
MAIAAMRAAGVDTTVDPTLGTPTRSGTTITVPVTRPASGALQTYWGFNGLTKPTDALSVCGFEISEDTGTTWSFGEANNTPDNVIRFTAEISGANIVLTKLGGTNWAASTYVRYLVKGPMSFTGLTAAAGNERLRGMIYEAAAQEGGLGLPVSGGWTGTAT